MKRLLIGGATALALATFLSAAPQTTTHDSTQPGQHSHRMGKRGGKGHGKHQGRKAGETKPVHPGK